MLSVSCSAGFSTGKKTHQHQIKEIEAVLYYKIMRFSRTEIKKNIIYGKWKGRNTLPQKEEVAKVANAIVLGFLKS